jgi:anti-anti-sigma factor
VKDGPFISLASGLEVNELSMDGVTVVLAGGDLDIASAPVLCEKLARRRGERVVLDLTTTSFCDVAGMRAITDESRANRARGGVFVIVAPSGSPAHRLLHVAGLIETVEVHDDRPRAISRVRPTR